MRPQLKKFRKTIVRIQNILQVIFSKIKKLKNYTKATKFKKIKKLYKQTSTEKSYKTTYLELKSTKNGIFKVFILKT